MHDKSAYNLECGFYINALVRSGQIYRYFQFIDCYVIFWLFVLGLSFSSEISLFPYRLIRMLTILGFVIPLLIILVLLAVSFLSNFSICRKVCMSKSSSTLTITHNWHINLLSKYIIYQSAVCLYTMQYFIWRKLYIFVNNGYILMLDLL